MSIYIIGSNSYIAQNFISSLSKRNHVQLVSSHPEGDAIYLDLNYTNNFDYSLIKKGDLILMLAAISSPDVCNSQYEKAYAINVIGTSQFIEKCLKNGSRVLFFSSDTVYGNREEVVNENSICNPAGNYAIMKYEVEKAFISEPNFKVFRLSYVFGKNDKFTSYLSNCSKNLRDAEIFHPFYRRVVWIKDLIDSIVALDSEWDQFKNQCFNICGPDLISRMDLATYYKLHVDCNLNYRIIESPADFFKHRPYTINMDSIYLNSLIKRSTTTIIDAMKTEFFNNRGQKI